MKREGCNDFKEGTASGNCQGDGHYMCWECVYFRKDYLGEEGRIKREIEMTPPHFVITIIKSEKT